MPERSRRLTRMMFSSLRRFEVVFSSPSVVIRRAKLPHGISGPRWTVVMSMKEARIHVVRNRMRRRYNAILQGLQSALSPEYAYVVNIKKEATHHTFSQAQSEVSAQCRQKTP